MLQDGAWLRHASHANAMAEHLEKSIRDLPEVKLLFPRQANAVFVEFPTNVINGLWERGWMFYNFIGKAAAASCARGTPRSRTWMRL